jgi:transitional endoplasmic reticulum ATPase
VVIDEGPVGEMVRVRELSDDACRAFIEFRNGKVGWLDSDNALDWVPGMVLLVDEDRFHIIPSTLWPEELWVGVVRRKLGGEVLISGNSGVMLVPDDGSVEFEVGYTVEVRSSTGVARVLSEEPIRYLDDPTNIDSIVERFRVKPGSIALTFDDFGGLHEVVRRAHELINVQLERHESIATMGAKPVKGILFTGPPGTGKTMLAKIIATQAKADFYLISGPEIFSKWYGQSEELLRKIFEHAAKQNRSIIFFDEIDSVAGHRDEEAHEVSKRVVAQLLTSMDGFSANQNTVVIAATNRPQDIDVALRRPGRFDWEIVFPLPSSLERLQILHASAKRHATLEPLPLELVVTQTNGWSAADLTALWTEAALLAAEDERKRIGAEDFLVGFNRVKMQRQRPGRGATTGQGA